MFVRLASAALLQISTVKPGGQLVLGIALLSLSVDACSVYGDDGARRLFIVD